MSNNHVTEFLDGIRFASKFNFETEVSTYLPKKNILRGHTRKIDFKKVLPFFRMTV